MGYHLLSVVDDESERYVAPEECFARSKSKNQEEK
jgi:hypothetical protein